MDKYHPPFTITNEMLMLTADISEKIGDISNYRSFESRPYLRRSNRIHSVYASLAIEANSLSLDEVRGVIAGKTVIGPQIQIQEVKNAYHAYEMLGSLDPFVLDDLLKVHGIMTADTVDRPGKFRSTDEGVFHNDVCFFIAPPPRLVLDHMKNLFNWMNESKDTIHPLILSSVFHYEFVFIHPFSDGNGRMARLWQTAILSEWKPIFQYLPLESRIFEFQDDYYEAISSSHVAGDSNPFILFMLNMINKTLEQATQQLASQGAFLPASVQRLLDIMEYDTPYTAEQLLSMLGLKSRDSLRKNYLTPAIQEGLIVMSLPDKPTSRNQRYVKK